MEIIVRATVIFFFLWGLMRAMGRRELSELTAFELVLLMVMGDLVQQGVTQEDMSITGAFLAVGTIGMWIVIFSYLSYRWKKPRHIIEGQPVMVVKDGELLPPVLAYQRVTEDEILDAAREQGIASLEEVRVGILEADGKFSFITGERHDQPDKIAD